MPVELLDLLEVLLNKAEESYPVNKTNIPDERKSEQAHIPHAPTLLACCMLYTMNGNSKH